jgi:hypothetical protein
MNRYHPLILILVFSFLVSSCTSNEIGNAKDVNPDAVYFDYEIWAEEGKEDVTVNLQFRMGGPNGTTLVLDEPAKVLLDGEQFTLDSAKFSGAYYELQKPLASFTGKHSIIFTDLNNKEYEEEFEFTPFLLSPDLPTSIKRGDLVFNFLGLEPVEYLHVSLTDTSFTSDDINDVDTVKNGRLTISADRLSTLINGPINLQFYKEMTKPLKNATREGGILSINYGLKRQFELRSQTP